MNWRVLHIQHTRAGLVTLLLGTLLIALATLLASGPLWASGSGEHTDQVSLDPALEREAALIFASVMSPFCPGRLLQDCPSSEAAKLRNQIRTRFAEGSNQEQVLSYLIGLYGDEIRSTPTFLIAWVAPFLALAVGGLLLFAWFRRKRVREGVDAPAAAIDQATEARIERELDRLN
jgi:cytochrome c-type biogenesis protein CcmH